MRKLMHLSVLLLFLLGYVTNINGQESKTVTGIVLNEKKEPLEGVTISVEKFTTTSSKNGNFSINVPTKSTKIYFTLVGWGLNQNIQKYSL